MVRLGARLVRWVYRGLPRLPDATGLSGIADVAPVGGNGERPWRVGLLGESSATGAGVACQEDALAGNLARVVAAVTGQRVEWRVAARYGATVDRLRRHLAVELATERFAGWRPDALVVTTGVNDVAGLLRRAGTSTRSLCALLSELRSRFGPVPIVLSGVLDPGQAPAFSRPLRALLTRRARRLNRTWERLVRDRAGAERLCWVPVPGHYDDRWFAVDRFHPSGYTYRQWGGHLGLAVAEALAEVPVSRDAVLAASTSPSM